MIVMVYGASACGKSAFAEDLCLNAGGKRLYVATMRPHGEDAARRILRHRRLREGKGFETLEYFDDLMDLRLAGHYHNILLESAGNIIADALFMRNTGTERAVEEIPRAMERLAEQTDRLVVVCDDVFADGVTYPPETEAYIGCMGEINRRISALSQVVVEVVCGLPIFHKGEALLEKHYR